MRVLVHVDNAQYRIDVGRGNQRLKWLATTAVQRHDTNGPGTYSHSHVPIGLMDHAGNLLPPNKSVRAALEDDAAVYVLLQANDHTLAPSATRGTSEFVLAQGASPVECLVDGPSLGYAIAGQRTFLHISARDTYANLSRTGGEVFKLGVSLVLPSAAAATSAASAAAAASVEPEVEITDCSNGSYVVSTLLPSKGSYDLTIDLDGEPIGPSPIRVVALQPSLPAMPRWVHVQATAPGDKPVDAPRLDFAAFGIYGRHLCAFGGYAGANLSDRFDRFSLDGSGWSAPEVHGTPPPACAASAAAVAVGKLLVFGGEGAAGPSAPLDTLHMLDLRTFEWSRVTSRGDAPGPRMHAAGAAIGNTLFVHGGWDGQAPTRHMHAFTISSNTWEHTDLEAAGERPAARLAHSMAACGSRLFLYGGKVDLGDGSAGGKGGEGGDSGGGGASADDAGDFKSAFRDLWVFDTSNATWASIEGHGIDVPHERWGHVSFIWGNQFVVGLGHDANGASNSIATINLDTYEWDAWDSSASRFGHAMALVDGKMLLLGGREKQEAHDDTLQLTMGGFMADFEGSAQISILHAPTIVPQAYTVEAWVCPAAIRNMSIIARTNEQGARSVWSHQLRLNANGCVEHYVNVDGEGVVVAHTTPLTPGQWYHVAGSASTGGSVKLFVNGLQQGDAVPEVGQIQPLLDRVVIGGPSGDGMSHFRGHIAEVRIWSHAISEDEIHERKNRALSGTERGLGGYWRLNDGPGAFVSDLSNYGSVSRVGGDLAWTSSAVPVGVGE